MRRPLRRLLGGACLGLLILAPHVHAEDGPKPEPPAPREPLALVQTDPVANGIARSAAESLAAGRTEDALAQWDILARKHPDMPIALYDAGLLRQDPEARGLYWPAARVANRLVATLEPHWRKRWDTTHAPATESLWTRAARGDRAAIRQLVTRYAATTVGTRAVLLAGDLASERASWSAAAELYREWLALAPVDTAARQRARVVRHLADALAALADAGGMRQLLRAHGEAMSENVGSVDVPLSLQNHLAQLQADRRERRRANPVRVAPALAEPRLVWSISLQSPAWQTPPAGETSDITRAGAWTDGDRWLIVHDGQAVRALDFATGVERWRFPRGKPAPVHHPVERYAAHARPTRVVTPAGENVLVVLGDLPASGSYMFHGERVPALGQARESRTRLASLNLETGSLQWATGLATETHPLLGDPGVGCISPPLVVGDRVYALFGRLTGLEIHAACLHRATGAPIWTRMLGSGESGRGPNRADEARLQSAHVDALPWGAQPALREGELCVVTHAGMAAGLDATTGALHWLRALPRYSFMREIPPPDAADGHSARNVPLPYGDTWILAPTDSPALIALARRSGAVRWIRRAPDPALAAPPWRHLLGVGADGDGHMRLRLSGDIPTLVDPEEGELWDDPAHVRWERDWNRSRIAAEGRPWSDDDYVMVALGGHLQIAPWVPDGRADAEVQTVVPLLGADAPRGGTVLRAGGRVIVVGPRRLGVFELGPGGAHRTTSTDPAADVVVRAMQAVATRDPDALEDVTARFERLTVSERRAASPRLAALLRRDLVPGPEQPDRTWTQALARAAEEMPAGLRAGIWRDVLVQMQDSGRPEDAYELARSWLESGDRSPVEVEGRDGAAGSSWMRADLFAAQVLRTLGSLDTVQEAARRREAHWQEVRTRAEGDTRMLQWIAERGRDTPAAHAAREELAWLALKRRDWAEAAAWLAELRSQARIGSMPTTLSQVAQWQLDESIAWGQAGHEFEARNLAAELVRWAPEGVRATDQRTLRAVRTDLQRRFAWHPERGGKEIDVWGRATPTKDEVRSVEWLALTGPGVAHWKGLVLLVRGFTPEIWSHETGRNVARLPVDDAWIGGTFHGVDEWVPGGGVLVASVVAGEPADRAGLRTADWVRSFGGEPIHTLDRFLRQVAHAKPEEDIAIDVRRGGSPVLSNFRPGVRPSKHGRAMDYAPVWVGSDGRALLPTRSGLVRVTPRPPGVTPFWTWSGDGLVRRVDVIADTAFVSIRRRLHGDSLVAVDVANGRERWRRQIAGRAARVEVTGSAVVVHATGPREVYVLDRWDGSVRARQRCFEPYHQEYPRHRKARDVSSAGLGRVVLVTGIANRARLTLLDTASGEITWKGERNNRFRMRLSPHVSMGAFVAAIQSSQEIRIVLPHPLDTPQVLRLDKKALLTDQRHHGFIDNDTRITVRGRRMFIVRIPGGGTQPVRPGIFEIDERALQSRPQVDTPQRAGSAIAYRTDMPLLGGDRVDDRYVIDEHAAFDGLLILAARIGVEDRVEAAWLHAEPIRGPDLLADSDGSLSLFTDLALDVYRHAPRRAGDVLLVPTDRGARVVPVRTAK